MAILRRVGILTALLSLSASVSIFALDPSRSLPEYVHDVWEIEDGLPQNSVHDIEQDGDGFMWLATVEGLVRFDGAAFTVFNKTNTEAIKNNEMRSFHMDSRNVLWIASYGGGLIRFENGAFTSFGKKDGLEETRVWEVSGSDSAGIWLATHHGLYRFMDGAFTRFTEDDGLAGNDVRCVHVDEDGRVWAGTMNGLSLFDRGVFKTFTTTDGLAHNKVKRIARDSHGRLWIGTHAGLNSFENGAFSLYTTSDGLAHESVIGIYEGSAGAMWFGTEGGANRLLDRRFASFTKEHGLSSNTVRSFYEDLEGSLWIGTETGGLNRLRDGKFTSYTKYSGLTVDVVWSFFEAGDGRLMIGSSDGLFVFNEGKFTRHLRGGGASNNWFSSLYESSDGTFWAGTSGDGLYTFENGAFGSFTGQDALANEYIMSMQEDSFGNLWIGTRRGLWRKAGGEMTFFSTADGLAGDVVRHIEAAEDGALWIGTGTGLSHYKDGEFKTYSTKDGLSADAVFSIHTDADGTLWLGTYGGGLNRYRDGVFRHVSSSEGLFDDVVYVILEDHDGNLWMTGNKGIFRVNKNEFDDCVDGRVDSVHSTAYGVSDGMKSRECNGGLQPAGYRMKDGRMWFPTIRGAVAIDPDHLRYNTVVPPVHIVKALADGDELGLSGEHHLDPAVDKLEFHYTALSFNVPEKVLFKYKLEGYDEDWVDAGTRRVAYYTNLPPGRYTFRVKGCNDDGLWNEAGAALAFRMMPYFWETTWFIGSMAALFLFVLWSLYRLRIHRMKRRERELEDLVALRTSELEDASLRDSLTGLRNRRFVTDILMPDTAVFAERKQYRRKDDEPQQAHPLDSCLGVFLIDIDHFKMVNDTLGHDAGDRVLKQFSELLSQAMRKDDVAVRWGGEEFLVILKHTSFDFVEEFAHRIRSAVERTDFVVSTDRQPTLNKTCSIGYVSFPFYKDAPELIGFEQAIMLADLGLYYSKHNGRNLAVAVRPTEKRPDPEELPRMLASLEYGTANGLVRIASPGRDSEELAQGCAILADR